VGPNPIHEVRRKWGARVRETGIVSPYSSARLCDRSSEDRLPRERGIASADSRGSPYFPIHTAPAANSVFGMSIAEAIVGGVSSIAAASIGAGIILLQIRRSADHTRTAAREDEARRLRLRIYEEVGETYRGAANAVGALESHVRGLDLAFDMAFRTSGTGPKPEQIGELLRFDTEAGDGAVAVVFAVEQWRVVDPRLDIFRTAINAAHYDVRKAFANYFQSCMDTSTALLAPRPSYPSPSPTPKPPVMLPFYRDTYLRSLATLAAHLFDFQQEMQNLLVGDLFGKRAPARQTPDPEHVVIEIRRFDELTEYFAQTPWGKDAAAAIRRVTPRTGWLLDKTP
jgi:hypothetical protein